ncbi:hypothetical protein D3C77_505550 [compost metagenome]
MEAARQNVGAVLGIPQALRLNVPVRGAHAVQLGKGCQQRSYDVELLLRAPLVTIDGDVIAQTPSVIFDFIGSHAVFCNVVLIGKIDWPKHVLLKWTIGR